MGQLKRSPLRRQSLRRGALESKRIEFEPLPAYAPELNPVEAMSSHAKFADLANYGPPRRR